MGGKEVDGGRLSFSVQERNKCRESVGELIERGAFQSVLEPLFDP